MSTLELSAQPDPAPAPAWDELAQVPQDVAATYERVRQALLAGTGGRPERLTGQAHQLMRDLGVTFSLYREDAKENIVRFDPFPRIIPAAEWQQLARGVAQRVAVWNAFLKDIYNEQEALKAGILPFQLVYDDPQYLRACVNVPVLGGTYVHVSAVDLARGGAGQWVVVEDYVAKTTGASYALQSRHVLSQVSPDVMELADILPIHAYPTALLEHLRHFTPGVSSEPRVVLLSPGIYNEAYYEHSYLARQMGIPLVRGTDLIVLNSQVYLKTIGGLEPIDVIYRRVDDGFLDPVAFREDSQLGVPGLMSCVRKGTVALVNAIGAGLGDNRAIAAYLPRLAKFYFNEPLQLPTVERLVLRDVDEREQALSNLTGYTVFSVSERSTQSVWPAAELNEHDLERLRRRILARPEQYVAQPHTALGTLPVCTATDFEPRHAGMRLFALGGQKARTYPIALTRYAPAAGSLDIATGLGGGIKDTWILRGDEPAATESSPVVVSPQRRLRLGSRIADSLYWMGRYAERAENTTRILKVLQQVQLESQSRDPQSWVPLWEALARATGHATDFFKRTSLVRRQSVSHYILLDRENYSSVLNCVEHCRANAQATRESVPPEVWVIINRLHQSLAAAASSGKLSDETAQSRISELQDTILNQIDALAGCVAKTMLRDDAWQFWNLGISVERALTTVLVMRQVFLKRQAESVAGGAAESNLDALLRMLSCQYAYRSLFQARPALQPAAMMLLQDPQLPRSLLFCLEVVSGGLKTAFGDSSRETGLTPLRQCAHLIGEVAFADLSPYFVVSPSGKLPRMTGWLDGLAARIAKLAGSISDHYLYHQAFNILR